MAINNVADLFVATLEQAGVKRIYGIVGDSLNGAHRGAAPPRHHRMDSCPPRGGRRPSRPPAKPQMTGSLAVCAGSCGPGNLHLINGLFDAIAAACRCWRSRRRSPRPRSAAAISRRPIRRTCSANAAIIASSSPTRASCLSCWRTPSARRSGMRGVAVVAMPGDVALRSRRRARAVADAGLALSAPMVRAASRRNSKALADLLNGAERITLFCGRGCAGAHAPLMQLAEALKSPIVHALGGKEHVEYDNPYDVGMTGFIGFSSGYARHARLRRAADAGHRFSLQAVLPDRCEDRAGRHPSGESRAPLQDRSRPGRRRRCHHRGAAAAARDQDGPRRISTMPSRTTRRRARGSTRSRGTPGSKPIHPQYLAKVISDHAARRCRLHRRCRHADGVGRALSRHERPPPADRLVRARLDGQRACRRRSARRPRSPAAR